MKLKPIKKLYTIALLIMPLLVALTGYAQVARQKLIFNNDWKFHKGEVTNGQAVAFNDSQWRPLNLPHDWSIEGPFSEQWASATAYLPGGIGWYRKAFTLSPVMKDKHVFIYFDGVYKNSEVWINGHFLGKRPNGFIAFEYELTPYLNKSGKNIIAVKVDHTEFADSRWYTGSGINRNVYLIAKDPVHIKQWGVAFTTPSVSQQAATALIEVSLQNQSATYRQIVIKATLSDKGNTVATGQNTLNVVKNGTGTTKISLDIKNPKLWSAHHPSLYQLNIKVYNNGKQTDDWSDEVGIRSFRFDADKGFFLNGENMKIKGVCLHDDAGALGTAVPAEVWERRLVSLKEAGCNAIRMSHNPHADYFYKLADKLGFLVMDESFDEWETGKNKWIEGWNVGTPGKDGYHEYFKEWADRDVQDMILRTRNSPSIIMWSIGNEIDYPNDPYSDPILSTGRNPQIYGKGYLPDHPPAARLAEISEQLVKAAKQIDTTRPVTAALAGVVMSNTTAYPKNIDVVGYNYQEYRYQEDHEKYPARIIYGSENGMGLDAWKAVADNSFISGQFLWTGVDYMGEAGKWPYRSNWSGLLDLAGNKKPRFYFRKSLWTTTPMINMEVAKIPGDEKGTSNFNYRDLQPLWNLPANQKVRVACFTNCAEAELFLNGKSLGKKNLTEEKMIYWDTVFSPGVLVVNGYQNGKIATSDTLNSAGKAVAFKTKMYRPVFKQNETMQQIEIQLIDEQGHPVSTDDHEVTVEVKGPGALAGIESADIASHEDYKSNKRKTYNGKLLLYVKQTQQQGNMVNITLTSPGLKTATISYQQ
ncbi:MAG: sugar-binding domain-containing protein [Ginsengibacter sp.]